MPPRTAGTTRAVGSDVVRVRPRSLLAVLLLALTATGCGFGLNTGNQRERSDWAAAEERAQVVEQRRVQHEATLNQIRNGTLPPTTTTLPDPDAVDDPNVTTTTQVTTTTIDPVVGPNWCYQIERFGTIGNSLYQSSNPEFIRQAFRSMIDAIETVATQGPGEVRSVSNQMLDELRTAEASWVQTSDRNDLRAQLFQWIDAKHGLVEQFLRVTTTPCMAEPIDGHLDPNRI
jgi:hypothetical protein